MTTINLVYDLTVQLTKLVEQVPDNEGRDYTISNIELLLEEREKLMMDILSPTSKEEYELGQKIIKCNEFISKQFLLIKSEIQSDLTNQKKNRTITNKYMNPYENINSDGVFFDKRK